MSKSILVIDTPKECDECPLHHSEEDICQATWEYNGFLADIKEICPLKPMPTTKQIENLICKKGYGFMEFDELLNEMLGGEE